MLHTRALIVPLLLLGCESRQVYRFELGSLGADYAGFVMLDAAGQPPYRTPLLGLDGPYARFGQVPGGNLEDGARSLVVVALSRGGLMDAAPAFDVSREAELDLRAELACAPNTLSAGGRTASIPLPVDARFFLLELEGPPGEPRPIGRSDLPELTRLSVDVPVDQARCRVPARDDMSPFGESPHLLPEGFTAQGQRLGGIDRVLTRAARLGPDRVLALAASGLWLFERGRPARDDPQHFRALPALRSMVTAAPDAEGNVRLAMVRRAGGGSEVWDVSVGVAGIATTETATSTGLMLEDVAFGPGGETVVVGADGAVLFRPAPGSTFVAMPVDPRFGLARVIATGDPNIPFLVGTGQGTVLELDPQRSSWTPSRVVPELLGNVRVYAVAASRTSDGVALWAAGHDGGLYRRGPRELGWRAFDLEIPEAMAQCAHGPDECGHRAKWAGYPRDLATFTSVGAGYMLLAPTDCHLGAVLRVSDGCLSAAGAPGIPLDQLRAADARDGWLTLAGEAGLLLEGRY